jgi:hypothetical protein
VITRSAPGCDNGMALHKKLWTQATQVGCNHGYIWYGSREVANASIHLDAVSARSLRHRQCFITAADQLPVRARSVIGHHNSASSIATFILSEQCLLSEALVGKQQRVQVWTLSCSRRTLLFPSVQH